MVIRLNRANILMSLSTIILLQLVAPTALASNFDSFDRANLKIYTAQGYYINSDLRSLIPLSAVPDLIDPQASPTCSSLIKANAPYLSQIQILPFRKMKPTDFKLYSLVQDALISRGQAVPQKVYRGIRSCEFLMNTNGKPVSHYLEKAFSSTSTSKSVAQKFTIPMNSMEENEPATGCLIEIEGVSGVPVAEVTDNYNSEEEVLFPANTLFEVQAFALNGEQKVFQFKEVAKSHPSYTEIVRTLNTNDADQKLQEFYTEFRDGRSKAGASKQFNTDAENACKEAYLFFTSNPSVRKSIATNKPQYDLSNKKLNPNDYEVEE